MALDLENLNRRSPRPKKSKTVSERGRDTIKPWTAKTPQPQKFRKAELKDIPLTDATDTPSPVNFNESFVLSVAEEFLNELSRRSYWFNRAKDWVQEIQITPKIKIPLPDFFKQRSE